MRFSKQKVDIGASIFRVYAVNVECGIMIICNLMFIKAIATMMHIASTLGRKQSMEGRKNSTYFIVSAHPLKSPFRPNKLDYNELYKYYVFKNIKKAILKNVSP